MQNALLLDTPKSNHVFIIKPIDTHIAQHLRRILCVRELQNQSTA